MHPRLTRQGAPRTQAPRGCVGVWPQPLGSQAQVKVQLKFNSGFRVSLSTQSWYARKAHKKAGNPFKKITTPV